MTYRNYIDMPEAQRDGHVYRIMPVHRLLECFQKQQLVLVPPFKWDDPFENMLSSMKVIVGSQSLGMQPIADRIYGQCWTRHRETDAMWRIYSPDKNGAKIRSTPRKLLDALMRTDEYFADVHCFIGNVRYLAKNKLVSTIENLNLLNPDGSGFAESLLYKRPEFSHESEVRLVYTRKSGDVHAFSIDPNHLIEQVVFDPRMDGELFKAYKAAVTQKGFCGRVLQSQLYRPPKELSIRIRSRPQ